ncbi:hypothetical protein ACK8P5_26405 (plasmid) [Paenibacillus sp. EC2-1]|uniref:hypothetical protein n=1 Tax=Paenibacillus sp. EC2-1 TaxID=3388665 RepID=UPI003BEF0AC9
MREQPVIRAALILLRSDIMIVKQREPQIGERVEVYVNLNKQGLFSILDREPKSKSPTSGKVIAYAESVELEDAVFKISNSKYNGILKKQQRAVCAVVVGKLLSIDGSHPADLTTRVSYNPYRQREFHTDAGESVHVAVRAHFRNKKVYI